MSVDAIWAAAGTQVWQVTAAIAAVGTAAWAFCRRRPQVAYALWVVVLVKCLVPPVWSSSVGVFSWVTARGESTRSSQIVNAGPMRIGHEVAAPGIIETKMTKVTGAKFSERREAPVSWTEVGLLVWGTGVLVLGTVWLVRGMRLRRRIEKSAVAVPGDIQEMFEGLQRKLAVRGVELRVSTEAIGPGLFGVARPMVVVPAGMVDAGEELRMVLAHELVHVKRKDHWVVGLQMAAQVGWWFHPLVWWMNQEVGRARELSCDEAVMAGLGCAGEAYGQMLLDVLKMRHGMRMGAFAPGMRAAQVTARRLEHVMTRPARRRMPVWGWVVALMMGLVLLPGAGLVLERGAARGADVAATAPAASQPAKALTFQGIIVEKGTGKPIAGAKVAVHRQHPPGSKPDALKPVAPAEVITTDSAGRYSVYVPPEQAAVPDDWIATEVSAEGYMSTSWDGWAIGLIERKNKEGDATFGLKEEMYVAEEVHGVLKDEQGNALAHVPVKGYSRLIMDAESDCWDETETDGQGRYSLKVVKGAEIATATAYPKDAATAFISIEKKRGDLGVTVAQAGLRLRGVVLDVNGRPVAGATVNAMEYFEQDGKFYPRSDGGYTRRTTADEAGKFVFDPMKAGKYGIETSGYVRDNDGNIQVAPGYFVPMHVTLAADSGEVKVQALPVVHVHTRTVDPTGKPTREVYPPVSGYFGGDYVNAYRHEEEHGEGDFELPRGVEKAEMSLGMMSDGKTIPRYKRGVDGKLRGDETIELGKLNEDVTDIYIVRYVRAELTVKAVDESGAAIKKFLPHIEYADKSISIRKGKYTNGVEGIFLGELPEGGWRAKEVLPGEEFRVSATAEGYEEAAQTVTLKEGEKREATLTLKRVGK